jgi:hypothetical protein
MMPLEVAGDTLRANFLQGIGEDMDGELYVLTSDRSAPGGSGGALFKLVPEIR